MAWNSFNYESKDPIKYLTDVNTYVEWQKALMSAYLEGVMQYQRTAMEIWYAQIRYMSKP